MHVCLYQEETQGGTPSDVAFDIDSFLSLPALRLLPNMAYGINQSVKVMIPSELHQYPSLFAQRIAMLSLYDCVYSFLPSDHDSRQVRFLNQGTINPLTRSGLPQGHSLLL
jgi:hypothetical protein